MQTAPADLQQDVLYGDSNLAACANRQVAELWPSQGQLSSQTASGIPAREFISLAGVERRHDEHVAAAACKATASARNIETLHQSLGLQEVLHQQHATDRSINPEGMKSEQRNIASTELGLGVGGLSTLAGDQGRLGYTLTGSQNLSQLAPEYWQQAMALAAVHRAAVAGQLVGNFPIMAPPQSINILPPGTQAMPASMFSDEKELKKQRRKLSNRESARRSRLRKQAEVNDMIQDVQNFTIANAHMKLEIKHLQECMGRLRDQNRAIQGLISGKGGCDAKIQPSPACSGPHTQEAPSESVLQDPIQPNKTHYCSGTMGGLFKGDRVSHVS